MQTQNKLTFYICQEYEGTQHMKKQLLINKSCEEMQLTSVIRRLQAIASSETHKIKKKKKSDFFLIQKHSL